MNNAHARLKHRKELQWRKDKPVFTFRDDGCVVDYGPLKEYISKNPYLKKWLAGAVMDKATP